MFWLKYNKVFTFLSFLRLRSPDIQRYQWVYPTLIFLCTYLSWKFIFSNWLELDHIRIFSDINTFMGILVGFYIAALAAVSSFSNKNLDQAMKGRPPVLISRRKGEKSEEVLTRRRFLSILFGYCAAIAIILYVLGVLRQNLTLNVIIPKEWSYCVNFFNEIFYMCYLWLIFSLLVTSLLGLHYLIDRIHRE